MNKWSVLAKQFWRGKRYNFPPGPHGLPIVGNIFQLGAEPYKSLTKMSETYGKVFSIRLGSYNAIVLSDTNDINGCLAKSAFSGRADFTPNLERTGGVPRGIIFNSGKGWQEQRSFFLRHIKGFYSDGQLVQDIIHEEISEIIDTIKASNGDPIYIHAQLTGAIFNVLWIIVSGKRYSHKDPEFQELIENLRNSFIVSRTAALGKFFPWHYHLRNALDIFFSSAMNRNKRIQKYEEFVNSAIDSHRSSEYSGSPKEAFISAYIRKIKETEDMESSFYKEEGYKNLKVTLLDLIVGGAETTASSLCWGLSLLAKHPKCQEKLSQEVKDVVGSLQLPRLADGVNMPYSKAVVRETLRFSSVAPLALFHSTVDETQLHGYTIPKGTLVIPNLYEVMHNPEIWGDPEKFRPERFLSTNETSALTKKAYMPFSPGKRSCPGSRIAQDELFLFVTALIQRFHVSPTDSNSEIKYVPATALIPKPAKLVFYDRFTKF